MEISAKAVMDLRKKTGVSMMACKKALMEAGGDEEQAIDILRKSGEAKAMKKSDRETSEGVVQAKVTGDNKKGALVQILCETDFVARNEDFQKMADTIADKVLEQGVEATQPEADAMVKEAVVTLGENMQLGDLGVLEGDFVAAYIHSNSKVGALVAFDGEISEDTAKDVAMHVTASAPAAVNPEDIDTATIEKEKEIAAEQLRNEGKPEDMIEKILEGKMNKVREENALVSQAFVKDPSQKVGDIIGGAKVKAFFRFQI